MMDLIGLFKAIVPGGQKKPCCRKKIWPPQFNVSRPHYPTTMKTRRIWSCRTDRTSDKSSFLIERCALNHTSQHSCSLLINHSYEEHSVFIDVSVLCTSTIVDRTSDKSSVLFQQLIAQCCHSDDPGGDYRFLGKREIMHEMHDAGTQVLRIITVPMEKIEC